MGTSETNSPDSGVIDRRSRDSRNAELGLLILAASIVAVAFILVQASMEQSVTIDFFKYGAAYLVLLGIAHTAVRIFVPYADPVILPIVALLNGLGLVLIHRLDLAEQQAARMAGIPVPAPDAAKQILWTTVSIIVFISVLFLLRDHRRLARYSYTVGLFGLVFLALPAFLPASISEVNGAKIWIRLPFISIQPAEFSKILLIIFICSLLVAKRELFTTAGKHVLGMDFPRLRDLAPVVAAAGIALAILVFQTDLGMSLLLYSTVLVLMYIATERVGWVVIGAAIFMVGATCAYFLFGHVRIRVHTWLDPFDDYFSTGFQISNSLFGLATGGLAGTGLGSGRPDSVPFAKTDFIVATIGEELGLIGVTAVLLMYLIISIRGFRAAIAVRDSFGKLLAAGLSFILAVQVFVVVGGVTKLIPLTGLTTPFLSYGGSSLLANYILVAILLLISHSARAPHSETKKKATPPPLADAPTAMVKKL
ncbi:FtsW/RodA/SpoVE family cell cycle protein [Hoyosella rhizosphaerae]|uniref:FtsW-like protein n=1 Tax=Hoyosella rhizosphaerae TaxID=1755582 RepID=A0A916U908_9ACTN|nr:FtsW/RodA/SpoVE family cell cycle protein [Hoyosella rhizosphaerae]MBN4927453.1 FtsW/RodA/SpoVE family cell cycle protein [Hoyosella rhizosphaerae]GGC64282.1 putative FtsW-like protein [Hoyosella rhizosphaerae]